MYTLCRDCFLYYLVTTFVPVSYQLWPGQCASKVEHRFLFSWSCGAGVVGRNCPEATHSGPRTHCGHAKDISAGQELG